MSGHAMSPLLIALCYAAALVAVILALIAVFTVFGRCSLQRPRMRRPSEPLELPERLNWTRDWARRN